MATIRIKWPHAEYLRATQQHVAILDTAIERAGDYRGLLVYGDTIEAILIQIRREIVTDLCGMDPVNFLEIYCENQEGQ